MAAKSTVFSVRLNKEMPWALTYSVPLPERVRSSTLSGVIGDKFGVSPISSGGVVSPAVPLSACPAAAWASRAESASKMRCQKDRACPPGASACVCCSRR